MDNPFRERQRKSYLRMRTIYDITMILLLLGMAVLMFFGPLMKIDFITDIDKLFRYLFGGLCVLYGGFRLYLAIKQDY
jgi:hypothetical protein